MRVLLAIVMFVASGLAGAQALLEFHDDLAFRRDSVDKFAERAYRARIESLAAADHLDRDAALVDRLRSIAKRIGAAAAIERPDLPAPHWEIHTCRDCGEQASAMAGGRILVGEEFVSNLALTDDELAYVVAHEAGHALAEHTREFASIARYFMDNGVRREYWDIQRELDNSFVVQLRMAFVSEQQEEEADYIGFILGARAGFTPDAMISLLDKLGSMPSQGFGTHPTAAHRLDQARAMLGTARTLYARSRSGS
jgi:predicted Zn-dependent protease